MRHNRWLAAVRLVVAGLLMLHGAMSAAAMARMDANRLAQPGPVELVICSPDGIKTIKLPTDGDAPAHENCECECGSLCSAKTPAASAGESAALPAITVWITSHRAGAVRTGLPRSDRKGDPCSPRAPPVSA